MSIIIIPAYNPDETLLNVIATIKEKIKEQIYIIIVNDGSNKKSEKISIEITIKETQISGKQVNYYLEDIYINDMKCLKTGLAKDSYGIGYTDTVLNMDKQFNAILAINGDYYGYSDKGIVIRNGKLYRDTVGDEDICIIYYDGTMKTFKSDEINIEQELQNGAYQAWSFGPSLLDEDKNAISTFKTSGHLSRSNPRTAIGYFEKGHYCFVVVDGRNEESSGVTLSKLAQIFENLGCESAYNLDGGKSSIMTFNDEVVNNSVDGGRKVSDCIYIQEVE